MPNVPWCHDCDRPEGICECEVDTPPVKTRGLVEALRKIAEPCDGPFGTPNYVPLQDIGKELRRRQKIAKDALEELSK